MFDLCNGVCSLPMAACRHLPSFQASPCDAKLILMVIICAVLDAGNKRDTFVRSRQNVMWFCIRFVPAK